MTDQPDPYQPPDGAEATQATDSRDLRDEELKRLRRTVLSIMTANRRHIGTLADAHQATIGELRRAEARVRELEAETALLRRYRDWLATQHANAVRADRAGGIPDHPKISPHDGVAAGLHTALLALDNILNPHDAGPTVAECADLGAEALTDRCDSIVDRGGCL